LFVTRQNSDTPPVDFSYREQTMLLARSERVRRLKALVDAGLYKVDSASLARAIARRACTPMVVQSTARSLDSCARA
jgi:hypothetical protein